MAKLRYCFDNIEEWIGQFMFCIMSLAVGIQLISRTINKPLFFTEEIARFSYIWIVFLCISLGEKRRDHYTVSVFTMFLKGRAEAVLEFVSDLICCLVFAYLFYWSMKFWPFNSVIKSPALELPMTVVSTSLCIGFGMAFIRRTFHAFGDAKRMIKGEAA